MTDQSVVPTFPASLRQFYAAHNDRQGIAVLGFQTNYVGTIRQRYQGFAPVVNFNAGVVAAGEAQIESTVTGNTSAFDAVDNTEALRNQSQVFLPINNALSAIG